MRRWFGYTLLTVAAFLAVFGWAAFGYLAFTDPVARERGAVVAWVAFSIIGFGACGLALLGQSSGSDR